MIQRQILPQIEKDLFKGKVIIVYGARQVGKTTLVQQIAQKYQGKYFNCDEPDIREKLTNQTSTALFDWLGNEKLVIFDEAQRVKDIGLTLKLIVDNFPKLQVIATGSSSFELSNTVKEPLTGRKYEYHLFPFSIPELSSVYSDLELQRLLAQRLIYGSYPEIVVNPAEAERHLIDISNSYLFKDILNWQRLKNPDLLRKLLKALALQIGSEVSYNELATILGVDKDTVSHYIDILEQSYIIFRLNPYSNNLRNELKKLRKIYFYDLGIRNVIINNLNPLDSRNDVGQLFENFIIAERVKNIQNNRQSTASYFWRNHQQNEVDLIEEKAGKLQAIEIKLSKTAARPPLDFTRKYPEAEFQVISKQNWLSQLLK